MWAKRTRRSARVSSTVNFPAICYRGPNRPTSNSKFPSLKTTLNPPISNFTNSFRSSKSKRKAPAKNSHQFPRQKILQVQSRNPSSLLQNLYDNLHLFFMEFREIIKQLLIEILWIFQEDFRMIFRSSSKFIRKVDDLVIQLLGFVVQVEALATLF